MICGLEGGEPRPLTGLAATLGHPVRWTPDAKFLYTYDQRMRPWRVMKLSVADGSQQTWKEITPSDPVGLDWLLGVDITGQLDSAIAQDTSVSATSVMPRGSGRAAVGLSEAPL